MKNLILIIIGCLFFACKNNNIQKAPNAKPNILFIAIDDLRPELGCYGNDIIHSPNLDKLGKLKEQQQPFFMGIGFFKPHLPFNAPQKYWDLYDRKDIDISPNPTNPKNVHKTSLHKSGEFNQYQLGEEKATLNQPISPEYARKIRHAYYASVSYVDAQVGRIMAELERLDLVENTIIVIWGDHGWHLGDQQLWGKHSLFENALRSTLIIKNPKLKTRNKDAYSMVESVDIYPTILDFAQLKPQLSLDGNSLLPIMNGKTPSTAENLAYSYFKNGISMRTPQYRLTKYYRKAKPNIELYDHFSDPNETNNIAAENPKVVKKLLPILEKGNNGIYVY